MLIAFSWKIRTSPLSLSKSSFISGRLRAGSSIYDELEHRSLYDAVRRNEAKDIVIPSHPFTLTSEYGTEVTKHGCNITVVFMDPRLATGARGESAWFALESVAAFLPDSCVLLQTATCAVKQQLEQSSGEPISDEHAFQAVAERLYENALPLFRNMIERGHVRMTIPNHTKYNLKACSDYGNPSSALMNVHYWKDEFNGVDSDLILFIQDDAVLCYPFDVGRWSDYAFVGSVWSKSKSFQLSEGMCDGMALRWNTWIAPQRRWERQEERHDHVVPPDKRVRRPDVLLDVTTFPDVCTHGLGPVGNGGLSLRSRSWAIKAIETCPHVTLSGVNLEDKLPACKVFEEINEDLYFAIMLRGLGIPLPNAYDASLFASEMLWPEHVKEMYGGAASLDNPKQLFPQVHSKDGVVTVPAGVHKPWWYHPRELLLSSEMERACPYLKYVFPSEETMRQWKEWQSLHANDNEQWRGIGS